MDKVFLREQIAPAESPGIDLLETSAADNPAQILAVLKSKGRNDPQRIRQYDLLDAAPDKGEPPQRFKIRREPELPQI